MKAAILHSHSDPLSIEEVDLPPAPRAGEAVVEVLAAPVAFYAHEVFRAERPYPVLLPLTPGCGAIARIKALGADATRLKAGQLVFWFMRIAFATKLENTCR